MGDPIIITLTGTNRAICSEFSIDYTRPSGSIISTVCRKIALAGGDLDRDVEVYRGDTICFHKFPLRGWCKRGIRESDTMSIREVKWKPFDDSNEAVNNLASALGV